MTWQTKPGSGGVQVWVGDDFPEPDDQDLIAFGLDERLANRTGHKPAAKCGTDSGYYRHRRTLREKACRPCIDAHNAVTAARKAQREDRQQAGQAVAA